MTGIKFQLSNYLRVPLKALSATIPLHDFCSSHWPYVEFPFFMVFFLRQKSSHIDMCAMEEHHMRPGSAFMQPHLLQCL